MSSANINLIACARCAVSKARCDKKVPCSQCVARNYICQPRCSSRRPRAIRKPTGRGQGASTSNHVADMNQVTGFDRSNYEPSGREMFGSMDTTLPQGPLATDPAGFSYPQTMDDSSSHMLYSSMSWLNGAGLDPQISPLGMGDAEVYKRDSILSPWPDQLATPTPTETRTTQSSHTHTPGMECATDLEQSLEGTHTNDEGKVEAVLRSLVDLLAQSNAWQEYPDDSGDAAPILSHDARDRIVAAVQLLLHRALCQNRVVLSPSTHGAFGRIVALPPSHVLVHFIQLYAARVDSIHPYLGLAGSPTINIKDILQIDMADVGILLVILLVTQGAMLTDHRESLVLAHGLVEICKLALNDVLETRSIAQPMVGGCALQLLTLCAWSGRHALASFAMSKRSQYLNTLKSTGILQAMSRNDNDDFSEIEVWETWKEQEQQNRHAYAWVYMDVELSLLHDVPPVLSINDLHLPLPRDNDLWHAQYHSAWLKQYNASGALPGERVQSLNTLFRNFLQGRLVNDETGSFDHLRLLLHPLQTMVLEQQQLLRIFDTDEPSNRYRVLSKIKVLGRLQETQDLLQHLTTLLADCSTLATKRDHGGLTDPANCVSMIMLHLVCLNVFTNISEIERLAKEQPPMSDAQRVEMWQRMRYPEGESYVLFHAGQVFKLIDSISLYARPTWWPIAMYRASLACWSLRSLVPKSPGNQAFEVSIDSLLPSEEERFRKTNAGTPTVTLPGGIRLPVLEGNNSLQYCIAKLESHSTDLVRSVVGKLRSFTKR